MMARNEGPDNGELQALLHKLHDRIVAVEQRLVAHYAEEHKSFNDALAEVKRLNDWIQGGRIAARIILGLAAFVAGIAAAWAWVISNFDVKIK